MRRVLQVKIDLEIPYGMTTDKIVCAMETSGFFVQNNIIIMGSDGEDVTEQYKSLGWKNFK